MLPSIIARRLNPVELIPKSPYFTHVEACCINVTISKPYMNFMIDENFGFAEKHIENNIIKHDIK